MFFSQYLIASLLLRGFLLALWPNQRLCQRSCSTIKLGICFGSLDVLNVIAKRVDSSYLLHYVCSTCVLRAITEYFLREDCSCNLYKLDGQENLRKKQLDALTFGS